MMHKKEVVGVIWLGLSVLVFLSLISFSPADLGMLQTPANHPPQNMIGIVGAWIGFVLYSLFGVASYLLVFFTFSLALLHFSQRYETTAYPKITGCILLLLSLTVFLSLTGIGNTLLKGLFVEGESKFVGGLIGNFLSFVMLKSFGRVGTYIIVIISFLAGVILTSFHESFSFFLQRIRRLKSYRISFPKEGVKIAPRF